MLPKRKLSLLALFMAVFMFMCNPVFASQTSQTIRLGGADRYETAIAIASEFVKDNPTDTFILANAFNYPDALTSAPLTKLYNAPVLVTPADKLNPKIEDYIKNMRFKKAIIVGGPAVITEAVENRLKQLGISTERLGGADRYETSMIIAERVAQMVTEKRGTVRFLFLATSNYMDVMTLSPASTYLDAPIILLRGTEKSLSEAKGLQEFMDKYTPQDKVNEYFEIYFTQNRFPVEFTEELIFGDINCSPLGGNQNEYVNQLGLNYSLAPNLLFNNVIMANGETFVDALCGVALAGKLYAPIVFTGNPALENDMEPHIKSHLLSVYRNTTKNVYYLGGPAVIPDNARSKIQ